MFKIKQFIYNIFLKIGILKLYFRSRVYLRRFIWPLEYKISHIFIKPKICIVQLETSVAGLFAIFMRVLSGIAYADRWNMIPVADMGSFKNAYLYDNEVGKINVWDYYFLQPAGISVKEAFLCKNFTVINAIKYPNPKQEISFFLNQYGQLSYWRNICKKYIRFTPEVIGRLKLLQEQAKDKKVLGVLVRGTDYIASKPKNHPIPPTAEQAIQKTQEVMADNNFDAIYLATEDKNILKKFKKAFGGGTIANIQLHLY